MFKSGFIRLRNIYNSISKLYTLIIVQHPFVTIVCYLLLVVSFSLGLFQIKFDNNSEGLTELRSSAFRRDKNLLDELFQWPQGERFMQPKLTDLGYYIEFIIVVNKPGLEFGKYNRTLFNHYNKFFDNLMELTVVDYQQISSGNRVQDDLDANVYKFEALCARLNERCSILGGMVRDPRFQKDFVTNKVYYMQCELLYFTCFFANLLLFRLDSFLFLLCIIYFNRRTKNLA
jgi:hypothetical protein